MMKSQTDRTQDGNAPFQPTGVQSFRLAESLLRQYTRPLGAAPQLEVMRHHETRVPATYFSTFGEQIRAKYAFGERQRSWHNPMIYRRLGTALSVAYHNVLVTMPLSCTITAKAAMPSPFPRASWQIMMAFPEVAQDRLLFVQAHVASGPERAARVDRSASHHPGQSGISSHLPYALLPALQGTARASRLGRGAAQPRRLPPLLGSAPPLTGVKRAPTDMLSSTHGGRVLPLQPVFSSTRAPGISPIMPLAMAQPMRFIRILERRDRPKANDNTLAALEVRRSQQALPGLLPQMSMLQPLRGLERLGSHASDVTPAWHRAPTIRATTDAQQPGAAPWLGTLAYRRFDAGITAKTASVLTTGSTDAIYRFTVIRQEERLDPPPLSYALAQPHRPVAREEQVTSRVREQEVVKVIHKEIQSYLASGAAVKQFSRADFAHIADHVYSSFARRLRVERERLGMR